MQCCVGYLHCLTQLCPDIVQIGDLLLLHKYQPMLIPPLPWRSLDSGGHLLTRSFLCRIGNTPLLRNALIGAQNNAEGGLSQVSPATDLDQGNLYFQLPVCNCVT